MAKFKFLFLCVMTCAVFNSACVDENISSDPTKLLAFSTDTVSFDTVFTTIPSRTTSFMIYNRNKVALNIASIRLGKGAASLFRVNVDGRIPSSSNVLENVEIKANDSLYVFVELTLDPNNDAMPISYNDSIVFNTNGNKQDVKLMAYGQDAIVFRGKSFESDTTLTAERPYVVFNYLHVAEGATLTFEAGTRLYFHSQANLIVDGNLVSSGTPEAPVLLRGDRFDRMPDVDKTPYDYMPGQWGSIYLQAYDGVHVIDHTTIRGADNAIMCAAYGRTTPKLTLKNSVIHSANGYGVYAQNIDLVIENSEISNCGKSCLVQLGGTARVSQSTIANYFEFGVREEPALVIANYALNNNLLYLYPIKSSIVENTIVFGSKNSEIALQKDTFTHALYNVVIHNCLIKSKKSTASQFVDNVWANSQNKNDKGQYLPDTVFVNTTIRDIKTKGYYNFQLDSLSIARNRANGAVASQFTRDLLNNPRPAADGKPDIGAYEREDQ